MQMRCLYAAQFSFVIRWNVLQNVLYYLNSALHILR